MNQIKKNIQDVVNTIRSTTELLYQQKTVEAYATMDVTLNAVGQVVDSLHKYKQMQEGFEFDEERVVLSLTEALEALEMQDTILLADILEYDFIEYLQEVENMIE